MGLVVQFSTKVCHIVFTVHPCCERCVDFVWIQSISALAFLLGSFHATVGLEILLLFLFQEIHSYLCLHYSSIFSVRRRSSTDIVDAVTTKPSRFSFTASSC